MVTTLTGARIFDGHQFLDNFAVVIKNGLIETLLPEEQAPTDSAQQILSGGILAPGFIDLQVNGGGGYLFNNTPTIDTLKAMVAGHRSKGTTSMTPTLISDSREQHQLGLNTVCKAMEQQLEGILGIHIEGPFFNPLKRGTHKPDYIRPLAEDDIQWFTEQAGETLNIAKNNTVAIVTLAPEQTQKGQIQKLNQAGFLVCAGHTDASHQQVVDALSEGLTGFTHLFNAMRPMTARDPGVVGVALADSDSWCGVIADGHHVHPLSLQVALNAKETGKIYLVSDAMATVGSEHSSFTLYDEIISEDQGRLINAEGRLAGSAIGMIDAVAYCHQQMQLPLAECLRMASLYPAQFIQRADQLGRIRKGYCANLVHFSNELQVCQTWINGRALLH